MIHILTSPWAWVPLVVALVMCGGSTFYAKPATATTGTKVSKKFFEGPGLTNSGAVSTVLSLLPLLLSDVVRGDPASTALLGVATLLFAFSTLLGVWLYSTVAARIDENDKLAFDWRLNAIQGIIVWCMVVAAGCFLAFILFTPLLKPAPPAKPPVAAAKMTLSCDAAKCVLAPK